MQGEEEVGEHAFKSFMCSPSFLFCLTHLSVHVYNFDLLLMEDHLDPETRRQALVVVCDVAVEREWMEWQGKQCADFVEGRLSTVSQYI